MPMFRGNARASERPTSDLDDLLRTTTISEPGRMACSYAASGSTLDAHRTVDDFSRGSSLCCLEPARLLLFLRRRVTDDPNGDASIVRIASTPRLLRHEGSRPQPTGRSAKATPYREKMAAFSHQLRNEYDRCLRIVTQCGSGMSAGVQARHKITRV
jgi:hypothetical protein